MNRNKRKKAKQASPVTKVQRETGHTHRRNSLQRNTQPMKGASEYSFQSKQEKKCVIL